MAELRVGVFYFHYETIRTQEYSVVPVYDAARNWECNKITLDIIGIVNKVTLATNKANPQGRVSQANQGDELGITTFYLTDYLMRPRNIVEFRVGDRTVVESPRPLPDGTRLTCDVKGGPIAERATFTQLAGDRTAVLSYRVVIHDSNCDNYLLSNCWKMASNIDQHGYTTRITRGRASFRKDFLDYGGFTPDDFRSSLLVKCPREMRRIGVDVDVNEAGDEATYAVVDREVTAGLGQNSDVVEVVGTVSSSLDRPLKDLKGAINQAGTFFGHLGRILTGDMIGATRGIFGMAVQNVVPSNANIGVARAIGRKGSNRATLARVATAFLADRFSKILNKGTIASATMTHNFDTDNPPWAEAKIICATFGPQILQQLLNINVDPLDFINTSNIIDLGVGVPFVHQDQIAPHLPGSDNTRGTWLKRLLTQALLSPPATMVDFGDQLPDNPPATQNAIDVGPQ